MPVQQTIIEFHDAYCRIFVWQGAKGELTLERQIRVPLQAPPSTSDVSPQVPESGDIGKATLDLSAVVERNGAAIRQALKGAGLRVRDAMVVIPKQWVNLRVVNLPSGDAAELVEMARFEAERHIPFDAERHMVSHYVARAEDIQGSQVIIAALDLPPAEEVTGSLEAAGVSIRNLDVSTSALCNALVQSGQWDVKQDATVAQIDIGETATDISILHDGLLVFARSIALGVDRLVGQPMAAPFSRVEAEAEAAGESPDEAPAPQFDLAALGAINLLAGGEGDGAPGPWLARLIQEIQRTHGYAHREFECQPLARVFVSGIGTAIPAFPEVLRQSVDVATELLDPFREGVRNGLEGAEADLPSAACALASGALVLPRQTDAVRLNLLPQAYVRKHMGARRKQSMVTTVTLVVALIVCAFVFADQTMRERRKQMAYYVNQVRKTKERAEELERKRMVLKILKRNSSREGSPLAILDTISGWGDLFEEGKARVGIRDFHYESQKFVKLTGTARTQKDLNEFITRLRDSGHFASVLMPGRSAIPAPNAPRMRVQQYTLMCYFRSSAKSGK